MKSAPSSTALLVARGVAFQSAHPRLGHLVPEDAGRLARRFAPGRSGSSWVDRRIVQLTERLTVPGLTLHYVLRKRRIEALVRQAIANGYRQLVVLGAGLDTLAIRLANEIAVIEIDHPETQRLKRSVAGDVDVEFLAADFTKETVEDALRRSTRYRRTEPALFLAEAVLLYLTEAEVRNLFEQLRARSAATRLIFTFWQPRDPVNFQNATRLADWWLRRHSEPGRWAIAPDHVKIFLEKEGFRLVELSRDDDYHDGHNAARGEHIAVAQLR